MYKIYFWNSADSCFLIVYDYTTSVRGILETSVSLKIPFGLVNIYLNIENVVVSLKDYH